MQTVKITGLTIYPVKSCGGINLQDAALTETGLQHDRSWLVVDAEYRFMTQRTLPKMALIQTDLNGKELVLTAPGQASLRLSLDDYKDHGNERKNERVIVQVWRDCCDGYDAGNTAAEWFSEFLHRKVRLIHFDPHFQRLCDKKYTGSTNAHTAYADGFPLLITSQASLDDLNEKLDTPVPMNRFRPNIVIDGIGPFEEDYVASFRATGLRLKPVKPCSRCEIVTTDQATALINPEPLRTLSTYRHDKHLDAIMFGQNAIIVEGFGKTLKLGDELTVEWNF